MRVFETHFLTTRWPKKNFLLGIVFFGGDYPPIANKCLSTVLVESVGFPQRTLPISHSKVFTLKLFLAKNADWD